MQCKQLLSQPSACITEIPWQAIIFLTISQPLQVGFQWYEKQSWSLIYSIYNSTSYQTRFTKANIPNQIYWTKLRNRNSVEQNSPNQTYKTESTKSNLPSEMFEMYRNKYTEPNLKPKKLNTPNQFQCDHWGLKQYPSVW